MWEQRESWGRERWQLGPQLTRGAGVGGGARGMASAGALVGSGWAGHEEGEVR